MQTSVVAILVYKAKNAIYRIKRKLNFRSNDVLHNVVD